MESVRIFRQCCTQWRNNATGLDYNVVFRLLDRNAGDDWDEIFDDIRILESGALEAIGEAKDEAR